jgi:hypothetical protein
MAVCDPEGKSRGDCCCVDSAWFSGADYVESARFDISHARRFDLPTLDPGTTSLSLALVTMLNDSTLSRVFSLRRPTPCFSGSFGCQPLNVNSLGVLGVLAARSLRRCAIKACCCSLILMVSRT